MPGAAASITGRGGRSQLLSFLWSILVSTLAAGVGDFLAVYNRATPGDAALRGIFMDRYGSLHDTQTNSPTFSISRLQVGSQRW